MQNQILRNRTIGLLKKLKLGKDLTETCIQFRLGINIEIVKLRDPF
jgi:hypothetical protein